MLFFSSGKFFGSAESRSDFAILITGLPSFAEHGSFNIGYSVYASRLHSFIGGIGGDCWQRSLHSDGREVTQVTVVCSRAQPGLCAPCGSIYVPFGTLQLGMVAAVNDLETCGMRDSHAIQFADGCTASGVSLSRTLAMQPSSPARMQCIRRW